MGMPTTALALTVASSLILGGGSRGCRRFPLQTGPKSIRGASR